MQIHKGFRDVSGVTLVENQTILVRLSIIIELSISQIICILSIQIL